MCEREGERNQKKKNTHQLKKRHPEIKGDSCSFPFQGPLKDATHKGGSLRGSEGPAEPAPPRQIGD